MENIKNQCHQLNQHAQTCLKYFERRADQLKTSKMIADGD